MKQARWWMRRRWRPRTFAEYMATPAKIAQRDQILAMCDVASAQIAETSVLADAIAACLRGKEES